MMKNQSFVLTLTSLFHEVLWARENGITRRVYNYYTYSRPSNPIDRIGFNVPVDLIIGSISIIKMQLITNSYVKGLMRSP